MPWKAEIAAQKPKASIGPGWKVDASTKPKRTAMDEFGQTLATFNEAVPGFDEIAAGGGVVLDTLQGKVKSLKDVGSSWKRYRDDQNAMLQDFNERRPNVAALTRGTGSAASVFVPVGGEANAFMQGGKLVNAARGAVLAGVSGAANAALGRGTAQERLKVAGEAAMDPVALGIGAATGGLLTPGRVRPPPGERAAARLAKRQDPAAVMERRNAFLDVGIQPAPVDVLDDSARGTMRAAASRQTPARQAVTDFRDARAQELPERMISQTRRFVSNEPVDAETAIDGLRATQRETANRNYAEPYAQPIPLTPQVAEALSTPSGQRAINDAYEVAVEAGDNGVVSGLRALRDASQGQGGGAIPNVSGATLDRVQIAMRQNAENLSGYGPGANRPLAGAIQGRRATINAALDEAPGLAEARAAYRRQEQQIGATQAAERAANPGQTDNLRGAIGDLPPEELAVPRQVFGRALEGKIGENPASAPALARRLATSGEQQARNAMLLGPDNATQFENAIGLEERAVRNANDIAPRIGSQTQTRTQDAVNQAIDNVEGLAEVGTAVASANPVGAAIGGLKLFVKSLGMNDAEAEALARMAIDPNQTTLVMDAVQEAAGPAAAQRVRALSEQALREASGRAVDRTARAAGAQGASARQASPAVLSPNAFLPSVP